MKKLIAFIPIFLMLVFTSAKTEAQVYPGAVSYPYVKLTQTTLDTTVTNAETIYFYFQVNNRYTGFTPWVRYTKASGTVAGTTVVEASFDRQYWFAASDTLTHTNVAFLDKAFTVTSKGLSAPYYRFKVAGSGTSVHYVRPMVVAKALVQKSTP